MNEIEKMYENAGVKADRIVCYRGFDSCIDNDFNCHCHNEKPCKDAAKIYPPSTAEKQIELIKWLAKRLDFGLEYYQSKTWVVQTQLGWDGYEEQFEHKNFDEALSGFINHLWQDLTEEEKQQVKGILE